MSLVRRVARPMLATIFVVGGLKSLRKPAEEAETAGPILHKVAEPLRLPDDPELLVRANGALMVGAGILLATGRFPRLAATALAGTLVPTTLAGHQFWAADSAEERNQQLTQFLKNMGLLGGVMLAAVDTEGRPGVAYRAKMAGDSIGRTVRTTQREAAMAAKLAGKEARLKVNQASNALN